MNAIRYTNPKKKAEEPLVPSGKNILDTLQIDGASMPCTGDCGIAEKAFILSDFYGNKELFSWPHCEELADLELNNELCEPPELRILPATATANCGISSNLCYWLYHVAPPPNMYDLVQEMGQVDSARNLPQGHNRYEIYLSYPTFVIIFVRVMSQPHKAQRDRERVAAFTVLQFTTTPTGCFHCATEKYFQRDTTGAGELP